MQLSFVQRTFISPTLFISLTRLQRRSNVRIVIKNAIFNLFEATSEHVHVQPTHLDPPTLKSPWSLGDWCVRCPVDMYGRDGSWPASVLSLYPSLVR